MSYSPERQLFKVMYEADNDKEDLDFYELTQVLVMRKKWGESPEWEGYTRAERTQKLKQQVLMREVREEINCMLESRIDNAYEAVGRPSTTTSRRRRKKSKYTKTARRYGRQLGRKSNN
jgi:hypothetical protein